MEYIVSRQRRTRRESVYALRRRWIRLRGLGDGSLILHWIITLVARGWATGGRGRGERIVRANRMMIRYRCGQRGDSIYRYSPFDMIFADHRPSRVWSKRFASQKLFIIRDACFWNNWTRKLEDGVWQRLIVCQSCVVGWWKYWRWGSR